MLPNHESENVLIREEHHKKVILAIESAGHEASQILFVSGQTGTGKTTLVNSIDWTDSFFTVTTTTSDLQHPSYSLITDLLDQTLSSGFFKDKVYNTREEKI